MPQVPPRKSRAKTARDRYWRIWIRSEQGGRRRQEDRWTIQSGVKGPTGTWMVVGLFDGVARPALGGEAASAASNGMIDAVEQAADLDSILPRLNEVVCETGGSCTALVALLGKEASWLLSAGDSLAFAWDDNRLRHLNAGNRVGNMLTACLGIPNTPTFRAPMQGKRFILATDGVTDVLEEARLLSLLSTRGRGAAVFRALVERGMPDNATLAIIQRPVATRRRREAS